MIRALRINRNSLIAATGFVVTLCIGILAAVWSVQAIPPPELSRSAQQDQTTRQALAISYELVPEDQWPPAAAADMREIPREDWNDWTRELASKRIPPARLDAWHWDASFSPENRTLSGEFRLEIIKSEDEVGPLLLPLGDFSAAISASQLAPGAGYARWRSNSDEADVPAVLGNQPDGQLAMLVDRQGVVTFSAIQQAVASSSPAPRFELKLPPAPRRSIRLPLPIGLVPQLEGNAGIVVREEAAVEEDSAASNNVAEWEVLLPADGPVTLRIEEEGQTETSRHAIPVIRHEQTSYRADRAELFISSRWEMRFPAQGDHTLHLHVPPRVELRGLTAAGDRVRWRRLPFAAVADLAQSSLSLNNEIIEGWQAIEIQVPDNWAGETIALEAIAVASLVADDLTELPRLVFSNAFWQSGTASIRVDPPLRFADLTVTNAQCITGLQNNQIDVQLFGPLAEIELAVQRRTQQPSAALATRLTLTDETLTGQTLLQYAQAHTPPREIALALAPGWNLTGIVLAQSNANAQPHELTWRQAADNEEFAGEIIVDLADQALEPSGFSVLVSTERHANLTASVERQAIIPVRPLQTKIAANVLLLSPSADTNELQVANVEAAADTEEFWQGSPLLTNLPGERVFDVGAANSAARLTWQQPTQPHSAQIAVHAELKEGKLHETFELRNYGAISKDELLVYVSESRADAPLQWTDSRERPVKAERITAHQQAYSNLPPTGELWRIELKGHLLKNQVLLGQRTLPAATASVRVGLATLLNSPVYQQAELVVTAPWGAIVTPELGEAAPEAILPLWPVADDFENSQPQLGDRPNVSRFTYEPEALVGRQPPGVQIAYDTSGQRSAASDRLRQPLIWRETLHWSLQTTGDSMCLSVCEIQQRQSRQFTFALPANASLIDVRLGGESLTWAEEGDRYTLDLPRGRTFDRLHITYSVGGDRQGVTSDAHVPWITYEPAVLSRTARLRLPHDLKIAHADQLPSASIAETIAARLLGPIAPGDQLPAADISRAKLPDAANQLVQQFVYDLETHLSQDANSLSFVTTSSVRQLLARVATDWEQEGRRLLVDDDALARDGWLPSGTLPANALAPFTQAPWQQSRPSARSGRERQLALAVLDGKTLVVTTSDGVLSSGRNWLQAKEAPIFSLRECESQTSETSWLGSLIHPTAWAQPSDRPWPPHSHKMASTHDGEAVYALPGNTQSVTLANVSHQTILNGFVLAITAVCGWIVYRQRAAFTLVAGWVSAIIALIVPTSWAIVLSGLPMAFAGGALVGFVASHGAHVSAIARKQLARRLRPRVTTAVLLSVVFFVAVICVGAPPSSSTPLTWQDPPAGVQPRDPSQVVYVMADESGQATGETVFAADELVAAVTAQLDEVRMRPRGYLLSAAQHRLALVDEGIFSPEQLQVALSFTVHALEPMVEVRLPLRRDDFQVATPQAYVTPLGRDSAVTWTADAAQLTLRGSGEHTVDIDLIADQSRAADNEPLAIALPRVANTSVEIGASDRPANARQIRLVSSFARIREFPLAGFSMVALGPLPEIQITTRTDTVPSATEFSTQILSWLRIGNSRTRLISRLILSDSGTLPEAVIVQVPASVTVDEVLVDGRVVTSRVSTETSADAISGGALFGDIDAQSLSIPLRSSPSSETIVELELSLDEPTRFGQLRFPRVRVQGAQAPVELWAISADTGLQIVQQQRRQVIDVNRNAFSDSWGANVDVNDVVRPVNANAQWHLSVLPPSGNGSCLRESAVTLRQNGARYLYSFDITPSATKKCAWRATLPDSLTVNDVAVTNAAGDNLLGHWAVRDRQLTMFTSRVVPGPIRITVEAAQTWQSMPPFVRSAILPLEGVSEVSSSLRIYCEQGFQVNFTEPVVPVAPDETVSAAAPAGTYLAGAFALAPGVNPPRVTLSAMPEEVAGRLTTRLQRLDGAWRASVRFESDATDADPVAQTLRVPAGWKLMEVAPATMRVESLTVDNLTQHYQLSWDDIADGLFQDDESWEVVFAVPAESLEDFAIPMLELPAEVIANVQQQFIVPRALAAEELVWETQSLEEVENKATPVTNQTERTFQVTGAAPQAGLSATLSAEAVVSLVIAQASLDSKVQVIATYFVQPQGRSHVAFRLPSGMNVSQAEINGLPVQTNVTADGKCTLPLFSNTQPQRLGLWLVGEHDIHESDNGATVAQIAEPVGLTVQETIWIEAANGNRTSPAAAAQQLSVNSVSERIRTQLDAEALSCEASSPLAKALLSREMQGAGSSSTSSFWTVQSCAAASASSQGVAQLFTGSQLDFAITRTRHERTTWPRWVLAMGLLAAAAIAWPHDQASTRAFAGIKRRLRYPLMLIIAGVCLLALGAWLTGSAALLAGVAWSTAALLKRRPAGSAA